MDDLISRMDAHKPSMSQFDDEDIKRRRKRPICILMEKTLGGWRRGSRLIGKHFFAVVVVGTRLLGPGR